MIQFNLTLPVQIINLVCTYYVLKTFLLTPVINRILLRKKEEAELITEIASQQEDVTNFQNEKSAQLLQFQKDTKEDFPITPLEVQPVSADAPEIIIESPSNEEMEKLTAALTKKVRHGH